MKTTLIVILAVIVTSACWQAILAWEVPWFNAAVKKPMQAALESIGSDLEHERPELAKAKVAKLAARWRSFNHTPGRSHRAFGNILTEFGTIDITKSNETPIQASQAIGAEAAPQPER